MTRKSSTTAHHGHLFSSKIHTMSVSGKYEQKNSMPRMNTVGIDAFLSAEAHAASFCILYCFSQIFKFMYEFCQNTKGQYFYTSPISHNDCHFITSCSIGTTGPVSATLSACL